MRLLIKLKDLTMRAVFRKVALRGVILLFFILVPSCQPPEGNRPVPVNLDLRFDVSTQVPAYFSFSRVILAINSIQFQGIRQAGNDVAFSTRPDQPVGTFILTPSQFIRPVTWFDIPEGVYTSMNWEVTLMPVGVGFPDDDDDVLTFDDYGLIVEGHYTMLDGTRAVMIFAIEEDELLRVQAVNQQNQSQITLIYNATYSMELVINPFSIFGGIPRGVFEQAEISVENGTSYMLITSDDNEELYDFMILMLARELRAIIK